MSEVKLLIFGSRVWSVSSEFIDRGIDILGIYRQDITCILSGRAQGADRSGEDYAIAHGIPLKFFPAEWSKYGKSAGYRRNKDMGRECTHALGFRYGLVSKGTDNMINILNRLSKPCYVVEGRLP